MKTKHCNKCGKDKPIEDFGLNRTAKDGRQHQCKACKVAYPLEWRRANPEKHQELMRCFRAKESTKEKERQYSREYNARHRDRLAKARREWVARYPEKVAAHAAVERALKSGKLVRADSCERCGTSAALDGHHPDYSKPLEVEWLCRKCHRAEHPLATQQKSSQS